MSEKDCENLHFFFTDRQKNNFFEAQDTHTDRKGGKPESPNRNEDTQKRNTKTLGLHFFNMNFQEENDSVNTKISIMLDQPWPTQIGSRATFLKNRHFEGQNLDFF